MIHYYLKRVSNIKQYIISQLTLHVYKHIKEFRLIINFALKFISRCI